MSGALDSDISRLPGVVCSRLVSRRRNGSCVTLQLYARDVDPREPVVVYAHGICGSAENFYFQLRRERRPFVTFDMTGCARSGSLAGANEEAVSMENAEQMYAPAQLRDDFEAVWRHATRGGRASLIVAHSYSTSLVTQWLASAAPPPRLLGVVLLGTHASLPPLAASRAAVLARALPLGVRYGAIEFFEGPVRWAKLLAKGDAGSMGTLGSEGSKNRRVKQLWLKWEKEKTAALYAASVSTFEWAQPADFERAYATTPLAVMWGSEDRMTPPDARILGVRSLVALRLVRGHAHWPFLDNPDVDAWLDAVKHALAARDKRALAALRVEKPPPAPPVSLSFFIGAEATATRECAVCGGASEHACARCSAPLCGRECQQLAWERNNC